mgnify:CR=1 FL=1
MDQFDRALESMNQPNRGNAKSSILILGGNPKTTEALRALLEVSGHTVVPVKTTAEFERKLTEENFNLILTTIESPDIQCEKVFEIVSLLSASSPVVGFSTVLDHSTCIRFVRLGGVDFFHMPDDLRIIADRVKTIIVRANKEIDAIEHANETSMLCQAINDDRHRVVEENQALSDDLANAFCDSKKRMQQVAIGAEFQTLLSQELEIESMLRTSLGYILARLGSLNVAVFLRDGEANWNIGAFINFDREEDQFQTILGELRTNACTTIASDRQLKRHSDGEAFAQIMGVDPVDYSGSEVVAFGCYYKKQCMAVMVLFRGDTRPFEPQTIETIDTLRSIFGQQLASILKIHRRSKTHWPSESIDDDDWSLGKAA